METPPPNEPQGQQPEDPKPFRPLPGQEPTPVEPATPDAGYAPPAPEPTPPQPAVPEPAAPQQPPVPTQADRYAQPTGTPSGGGYPPPSAPPDQGSYGNYPRSANPGTGKIRFEILGEAFRLVFADLQTWALASLIIMIAPLILLILAWLVLIPVAVASGSFIITMIIYTALMFGLALVMNVLFSNFYRMAAIALTGTKPNPAEMLKFGPNTSNIISTSLISAILIAAGYMLCFLPGVAAAGLLMFAIPITVDKRIGGMQAIQLSYETLKSDALMAILFMLVLGLCAGIGSVVCFVGAAITLPVLPVAVMMLYRDYFGGFENAAALSGN